jgi:hypothetical protein
MGKKQEHPVTDLPEITGLTLYSAGYRVDDGRLMNAYQIEYNDNGHIRRRFAFGTDAIEAYKDFGVWWRWHSGKAPLKGN